MATLANTFEGGTASVTISTANSGGTSGDAFGAVTIDGGETLTFDTSTAAHGSVSAQVACPTSGSSYVAWTSGIAGTSATVWARAYYRFTANPGAAVNVLRILSSANGIMGSVRVNANGTIGMLWGSGTLGGTTVGAITANGWFRIEVMVTAGTTTGAMTCRVFFTPDATTPDETLTATNVNTGSANPTRLRVGVVSNATASAFNFDDLALSDVNWIGPAGGSSQNLTRAAADTLQLAHSAARSLTAGRALTGSTALTHTPVRATAKTRTAVGGLVLADAATGHVTRSRAATGTLTLTGQPEAHRAGGRAAADALALADSAAPGRGSSRAATDALSLTDAATPVSSHARAAADTTVLLDAAHGTSARGRAATDTITMADAAALTRQRNTTAAETLTTADTAAARAAAARAAANALTLDGAATARTQLHQTVTGLLVLADVADAVGPGGGHHPGRGRPHLLDTDTAVLVPQPAAHLTTTGSEATLR